MIETTRDQFSTRKGLQERWEMSELNWIKHDQDTIFSNLQTLGFIDTVNADLKQVDAICILGGIKERMEERMLYTSLLIKSGLQAKSLILLTGERYVTANIDGTIEQLSKIAQEFNIKDWTCLTETHLMQKVYDESYLSKLCLVKYVIDTPKHNLPRPTTQTTTIDLVKWLKSHKEICSILFISNQPYVKYQEAIIHTIFYENNVNITYEVVGTAAKDKNVQAILEGLGSYIWAASPLVLTKTNIKINTPQIRESFRKLYSSSPLIYDTLPENLK